MSPIARRRKGLLGSSCCVILSVIFIVAAPVEMDCSLPLECRQNAFSWWACSLYLPPPGFPCAAFSVSQSCSPLSFPSTLNAWHPDSCFHNSLENCILSFRICSYPNSLFQRIPYEFTPVHSQTSPDFLYNSPQGGLLILGYVGFLARIWTAGKGTVPFLWLLFANSKHQQILIDQNKEK